MNFKIQRRCLDSVWGVHAGACTSGSYLPPICVITLICAIRPGQEHSLYVSTCVLNVYYCGFAYSHAIACAAERSTSQPWCSEDQLFGGLEAMIFMSWADFGSLVMSIESNLEAIQLPGCLDACLPRWWAGRLAWLPGGRAGPEGLGWSFTRSIVWGGRRTDAI